MLIKANSPMAQMIRAVYVDDVLQENVLCLNPGDGWVEVHDQIVSDYFVEGKNGPPIKMLKYSPSGAPIVKRIRGKIRIEWHETSG